MKYSSLVVGMLAGILGGWWVPAVAAIVCAVLAFCPTSITSRACIIIAAGWLWLRWSIIPAAIGAGIHALAYR